MRNLATSELSGVTYYNVLGIPETATEGEIKRAYRRLIRQIHPDKFPNSSPHRKSAAEKRSGEVIEAYYVLSDSAQRSSYDQQLARHRQQPAEAPPPQQQRAATTSPPRSHTSPPSPRRRRRTGHPEPKDKSRKRATEILLFCGTLLIAAVILLTLFIDILISFLELAQPS